MIVPRGSTVGLFLPRRTGRRRGLGWRPAWSHELGIGLGAVSPVGFADYESFQQAVLAAYPACQISDLTCQGPRDASIAAQLASWASDPNSCHNVVCNSSGSPAISVQPYTTPQGTAAVGMGYNTVHGFVPTVNVPTVTAAPAPVVTSPVPAPAPVPIQSASPATAPGGVLAPVAAPTPVQTQTPPADGTTPGTAVPIDMGATPTPDVGSILSSIPLWGWGVAAVALILITQSGGKR